ncbi:chemotaxis protein CheA [Seohaeicola saemankumensis]|nr:chemotaxis protein CheA [Seohaeicola saemankumensis]MCA0870036.1 chemotaxis protein CheA [Seohaeicola saemankumensis]
MVHSNKVLTVSYGTFSCTLEGFEDSFDTMKAIAEYFRDLAADDRYFGAEPPQPDAEMLARIAQREISRQVEARQEATGIVLRAADATQTAPPAAPEQAPEKAPEPVAEAAPAVLPTPVAEVAEVAEPEAAEVAVEPAPEPVAQAEPEVAAEAEPEVMTEAESEAEPEAVAETVAEAIANVEPEPEADAPQAEIEDAPEAEAVAEAEAEPVAEAEPIEAEPVEAEQPAPAPDSIAAKLQRIRAVVSRNEQMAAEEEDYSEDQHADGFVSEAASEITAALDIDEDDATEADSDDEVDSILRAMDAVADAEDDAAEQDAAEEEQIALTSDIASAQDQAELEAAEDEVAEYEAEEEAAPEAPAARILKVKRADFEAALAAGNIEEVSDEDEDEDEDVASAPLSGSSLSPEEEADLLRELAEVEAEVEASRSADDDADIDSDDDDADLDDDAEAAGENLFAADDDEEEAPASPARAAQSLASETEQDDLSRLMDTADEKLGDPESSSNRDAYSQLRAAVAAAEAERSAGGTVGSHTDDDPYREDLANVVRPRRPVTTEIRPRRPDAGSKPAPLKLVAEQRVDEGAMTRGPVRPRRISTLLDDPAPTGVEKDGFAEFAAEAGATELPDLLEAAAAYMSFVEGRDQFSRPQLMNKVRQAETREFNREDGLRSFGQLLRDGKIEKTGGGRFTASGEIGFRPDGKRAAG